MEDDLFGQIRGNRAFRFSGKIPLTRYENDAARKDNFFTRSV